MDRLKELERVHTRATRSGPGRRWGTEQLNRSLFIALVAQFQTYCRALHDEGVAVHLQQVAPAQRQLIRTLMTHARKLDTGNPRTSALGSDFANLDIALIPAMKGLGAGVEVDLKALDRGIDFRNAISHGNDAAVTALSATGAIKATKRSYTEYREMLDRLAGNIDGVVAAKLAVLLGIPDPW